MQDDRPAFPTRGKLARRPENHCELGNNIFRCLFQTPFKTSSRFAEKTIPSPLFPPRRPTKAPSATRTAQLCTQVHTRHVAGTDASI